jgi:hypothetical protein
MFCPDIQKKQFLNFDSENLTPQTKQICKRLPYTLDKPEILVQVINSLLRHRKQVSENLLSGSHKSGV